MSMDLTGQLHTEQTYDRTPKDWLSLQLTDRKMLSEVYMPFIRGGGLFVPSQKSFQAGQSVGVIIKGLDPDTVIRITGRIVWVSPASTQNGRAQGVGIQLSPAHRKLKDRIEHLLDDPSGLVTHTL